MLAPFGAGGFYVLIISILFCYRPPGAIFFLLRRRKNMERKTPRRAGCSPPYEPTPLGGCRWCGWLCFDYQANLPVLPCPIPGEQTACRFAVAYALRWGLDRFFRGRKLLRLNDFHAKGLTPSGGHILSSPAKKEYGKKDAAQGGGTPPYEPTPLGGCRWCGWVSFGYQANLQVHPCPDSR